MGYPDEAISGDPESLKLNIRGQKGIIQRKLEPGDVPHLPFLEGYELDFLLANGMSGGPIFIHQPDRDVVIGVCVGTFGSETFVGEYVEIEKNGQLYRETKRNFNQYGVAERISPLLSWKPEILEHIALEDYLKGKRRTASQVFPAARVRRSVNLPSK